MKNRMRIAIQVAGALLLLAFIRPAWKTEGYTWNQQGHFISVPDCGTEWSFLWVSKGVFENTGGNYTHWTVTRIDWARMAPILVIIFVVSGLVFVSMKDKA